jgi:hypothetical protein
MGRRTRPKERTKMSDDPCAAARLAITTRNFIGWRGLPEACAPAALFGPHPRFDEIAASSGTSSVELDLPGYELPGVTFVDGHLVDFAGLKPDFAGGLDALLSHLGQPEATLRPLVLGTTSVSKEVWVYARRGITLEFDPPGDHGRAYLIRLYSPMAIDRYRELFDPPRKIPWPVRKEGRK